MSDIERQVRQAAWELGYPLRRADAEETIPLLADRLPRLVAYLDVDRRQTELRRLNYVDEYLRSEHWQATRHAALGRARFRCERCGTDRRLHVHHLTYVRLGAELDEDLEVLCISCHYAEHGQAS